MKKLGGRFGTVQWGLLVYVRGRETRVVKLDLVRQTVRNSRRVLILFIGYAQRLTVELTNPSANLSSS